MQTGLKRSNQEKFRNLSSLSQGKKFAYVALATVLLFLLSMPVKLVGIGLNSPVDVVHSFATWIQLSVSRLSGGLMWLDRINVINEAGPTYYETQARFWTSLIVLMCGMLLALSGYIFQTVFRNPIAAPTMLGVSTGVQTGIILLYLTYGDAALSMPGEKYKYSYICALIMLAATMLLAKISSGKRKFSVIDMLIVAAIFSQVVSGITSYYVMNMDNDRALYLQRLMSQIITDVRPVSLITLAVMFVISIIPFRLLRFSFNVVAFDADEAGSMGLNTRVVKFVSLVIGSLMVTAAMVHCGMVGMISLIVPFIARGIFGAEASKLFWGNLFIGGIMLLLCKDIAGLIPFPGEGMPLGSIVEFVAVPFFVLILASRRRTWE